MDVFFDNFSVCHTSTDVVQKDDYYPFGGSFNAYSNPTSPQRDYLFNGVRLNTTTQLYKTAFRTYDPYLGRFNHIDPLTASIPGLSPYHFGFNNPVRYSDPMGLMGQDAGIWGTSEAYQEAMGERPSDNPFANMPGYQFGKGFTGPGSGHHWSDPLRDPYHNWMVMGDARFQEFSGYKVKYRWVDHSEGDNSGLGPDGVPYVTAKRSTWEPYFDQSSGSGPWETAIGMTIDWALGTGKEHRTFTNDEIANSFRDSWIFRTILTPVPGILTPL